MPAQKEKDIIMETTSRFLHNKQYMWYKVRELCSKGLNKTQIGRCLGVDRSTVRRYLAISREEFIRKQNSHRRHKLKLGKYEEYVRGTLEEYPYISAARIHDWLRECYPDFPQVCGKTVFNFVRRIRENTVSGRTRTAGFVGIMRNSRIHLTGNMRRLTLVRNGYRLETEVT